MSVRSRLGLAALGSYLASVGTMLTFGVSGGLPAWLSRELAWGMSMSAAVSAAAVVSGVCLVLGAASQRSGPAVPKRDCAGSPEERGVADSPSAAARSRGTSDVGEMARRSFVRENRAPSSATRPSSVEGVQRPSEVAALRDGPATAAAQAGPAAEQESECPVGVEGVDRDDVGRSSVDVLASEVLSPDALIRCWRRYRDEGDGHFRAAGLRAELTESGFAVEVLEGRDLGVGDDVLVVPTGALDGACYLVPSFAKSPGAVGRWFEDRGDRSLSRRVNDVAELAEGRRTEDGVLEVRKGAVS